MLRGAGVDRLSFGAAELRPRRAGDPGAPPRSRRRPAQRRTRPRGRLRPAQRRPDLRDPGPGPGVVVAIPRAAIALGHAAPLLLRPDLRAQHADRGEEAARASSSRSTRIVELRDAPPHAPAAGRRGLPAYEISNYAAPGEECRHNLVYWTGGNYIGLGPSAASHVEGWRWQEPARTWANGRTQSPPGTCPRPTSSRLSPRAAPASWRCSCCADRAGSSLPIFPPAPGTMRANSSPISCDRLRRLGLHRDRRPTRSASAGPGLDVADAVAAEFLA